MGKNKIKTWQSSLLFLIILASLFFLNFAVLAQEIEYPQISGAEKITQKTTIPQYLKYLFNLTIGLTGLICLAVLILGGLKWLTSAGNLAKISEAKNQIFSGLLGLIILLSAYIILTTINPDLTIFRFHLPSPAPLPLEISLPTKEKAKTLIAYEIPLGKLIDGNLIEGDYLPEGIPESNAIYGKSQITSTLLDEYKNFGPELEGKWQELVRETDPLKMEELKQELQLMKGKKEPLRFQESYFTKIDKVAEKTQEILELTACQEEEECFLNCDVWQGESSVFQCRITGLQRLLELIGEFQKRKNEEIETVRGGLENAVREIKNILNLDLIGGTAGFSSLFDLNEKYDSQTENLVKEIVDQSKKVKIVECCPEAEFSGALGEKIAELQTLTEVFQEGYQIRKDLWEVSKQSIEIKKELDNYRTIQQANLKLKGSDYVYEGVVPPSRLERILKLNSQMREKSNQIIIVSMTMNAAAGVIAALTATCNCIFCGCGCGPCFGDPCAPVRPALIASQAVLAAGAATLPPLSSQLQKDTNQEVKEREELANSVAKSTEGLEKAGELIRSCVGRQGEFQRNLFSLHNFLNYKSEVEKYGYRVRIIKTRPEIEIRDDTYTYYCIDGPVIPGLTESSYPFSSSPYGKEKVICERKIEVGELIDSVKRVVKDKNQILDQMQKNIKSSQAIINEASKMTSKTTSQGTTGDLLQKNLPPALADKIPREVFRALSGEQLSSILKDTLQKMPEKYTKDLTRHLLENLPNKAIKEVFGKNLEAMSDKDLKSFLSDYFGSLKNQEKKRISQAIFEELSGQETKKVLSKAFSLLEAKDQLDFWKETLDKMEKEGRDQFFKSLLEKTSQKDLLRLADKVLTNLSPTEKRQLLKEILELAPEGDVRSILRKYYSLNLDQDLGKIIENIPEKELKEVSQKVVDSLYQSDSLKRVLQSLSEESWERVITHLSDQALKEVSQIIFEGQSATNIINLINFDILEFDPGFLQRVLKYLPEKNTKEVVLKDILGSIKDKDFKDLLEQGVSVLESDPRAMLNNLVLKQLTSQDQIKKAAEIIKSNIADEFLAEAIEVMPELPGLDNLKDMLDKISPYLKDIPKTINLILDQIPLPVGQLKDFLGDILKQLPEGKLEELIKEIGKYLPLSEIKKTISEIAQQLPVDDLRKGLKDLFSQLPAEKMRKIIEDLLTLTPKEFREEILKILKEIPDAQLPDLLGKVLEKIPKEKLAEALNKILKEIPSTELTKALESILAKVPEKEIAKIMAEISKIIPKDLLRDFINLSLDKLPLPINKVLDELTKAIPVKDLKELTDKIFKDLNFGSAQELMEKISSYLPDKLLGPYIDKITGFIKDNINKITGFAKEKLSGIIDELNKAFPSLNIKLGNFGDILGGVLSGRPALKQNAKEMILLPPKFTSVPCGCACPHGIPTPCVGPTPPGPYSEVLKMFKYISLNNLAIIFNQLQLTQASQQIDDLIEKKIKGDIYSSLRNSRKDFGECFSRLEITPPLERQLYRCQDAQNYGWLEECQDPFNFVCCYPAR